MNTDVQYHVVECFYVPNTGLPTYHATQPVVLTIHSFPTELEARSCLARVSLKFLDGYTSHQIPGGLEFRQHGRPHSSLEIWPEFTAPGSEPP